MTASVRGAAHVASPVLPWREWEPTISTLHRWLQVVGKIRMALTPPLNHWWHVPLYVTSRGLTTSAIPHGPSQFQVDLDFIDHRLTVTDADPGVFSMELQRMSVARFYRELMDGLGGRGTSHVQARARRPAGLADRYPIRPGGVGVVVTRAGRARGEVHLVRLDPRWAARFRKHAPASSCHRMSSINTCGR